MSAKKILVLVIVLASIILFYLSGLQDYFNLAYFQEQRDSIVAYKDANFASASVFFFFLYVVVAVLSMPAAAILTIAGGAVFGFAWALILVSFASTIGATLAFLITRTLLHDWVQARFGHTLKRVNEGIERDGVFYLFTLRLIPAFPFFLVNVLMALTPVSTASFYIVSQLGMLFGTALYVNVGAELGMATTLPDIFGIGVIRAIVVLAIFPWLAKGLVRWLRNRHTLAPWRDGRPQQFDTNMVVIGAGSAGLVTAYIAAVARAKVTLVEKHRMGGDCLNTGCVPSKALIRSAGVRHLSGRAKEFGLEGEKASVDFYAVMDRVRNIVKTIEPHDSIERYTRLGVDCLQGEANITSPWTVSVNGEEIRTRNIVIATGARPFVPPVPGLASCDYLTSDNLWDLEQLPGRLMVMGAGPIGCELAQAFARLGSTVTLVDMQDRILPREDTDVSASIAARFGQEGIRVITGTRVNRIEAAGNSHAAFMERQGGLERVEFDRVLVAVGRQANVEHLGLKTLGIECNADGSVKVNEFLQTNYPNIFACGDVAGPYQFTHMASFQAWFAAVNGLFGTFKKFRIRYDAIPWATFTDPEVARVGLSETEAREKGIDYELTRFDLGELDRAVTDSETTGFVKVLTVPGKDRIVGAVIVGAHASELINEFILAMSNGLGLKKIMAAIHVYPTWSESGKFAAGAWRKAHAPEWAYPLLDSFHRLKRK
jgi:dihydrolipoamide dehydrogenase